MARINKGLTGFSGKISNIVFSSWNGIEYIRSLPHFPANRKFSEKQLIQQDKLANIIGVEPPPPL